MVDWTDVDSLCRLYMKKHPHNPYVADTLATVHASSISEATSFPCVCTSIDVAFRLPVDSTAPISPNAKT